MEGLCSCKAGWCARIPHSLPHPYKTHFAQEPWEKKNGRDGGGASVASPAADAFPNSELTQAALSFQSVAVTGFGGGPTRGCVSPRSMQIQL